ncbi:MAG: hypothetical protein OEY98_13935, partial [Acidimicrobiia bacterium]|nr:hypothetical protein [Acidimicrobiia bacterium]
ADVNTTDSFDQDSIRVRIWEERPDGTEWVVYDSGRGSNDDGTEAGMTLLGGGSIKIHVPKGKAR